MRKSAKSLYRGMVAQEWARLVRDHFHKLEYETTLCFLKKYLPKNGLILDAGAGTGRYTIEMAKRGYEVIVTNLARRSLN